MRQWIGRFCNTVFFWFGNTGADAAIAILLPTLKHFSCNGAVDWSTTCFCYESILQKRWQFCDCSAWISKRVWDSSQSCCSISSCHKDLGSKLLEASCFTLKKRGGSVKTARTPENIAVVREEATERSPHHSARHHTVSLWLSEASVRRILHKDHSSGVETSNSATSHRNSCGDASKSK